MGRNSMLALFTVMTLPLYAGAAPTTSWYVTTATTPDPTADVRIALGPEERTLNAGSGWSCTISAPLAFGGRTTTCRKGSDTLEFSVECSGTRHEDHVQIRFRDGSGSKTFIEVGCRAGA